MTRVSRRQAALLAALLDADGEALTYVELGQVVGTHGVADANALCQYVYRLQARGVHCVAVVAGVGLRLVGLPPDWALDDVLALLDEMRRDGWEQPRVTGGRRAA